MDEEDEELPPLPNLHSETPEYPSGDGVMTNDAPKINGTLDSHIAS